MKSKLSIDSSILIEKESITKLIQNGLSILYIFNYYKRSITFDIDSQ
jgi:hypothetical protein